MTIDEAKVNDRHDSSIIPTRSGRVLEGIVLGALSGVLFSQLGIGALIGFKDPVLLPAIFGVLIALTSARVCLRLITGILLVVTLLIGYTPLIVPMMRVLRRTDQLHNCPAIVVLSSVTYSDGSLSAQAIDRTLHADALLRQGYARELVMDDATGMGGSQIPGVSRQMKMLGLSGTIEDIGPAADTHDEALGVARLARQKRWSQVILVTHPWHMRRAAAAFEKVGVSVLCSPCPESDFDLNRLDTPMIRIRAFRDWLHEAVGYQIYRYRGWI